MPDKGSELLNPTTLSNALIGLVNYSKNLDQYKGQEEILERLIQIEESLDRIERRLRGGASQFASNR